MPWKEVTPMSQRKEFIALALTEETNVSQLSRGFGISRKTAYKWMKRYLSSGEDDLRDRSRKPLKSPNSSLPETEEAVLKIREAHPSWGGRKIRRRMQAKGWQNLPSASTITAILRRQGKIDEIPTAQHRAWQRFEAERPNDLWQMDFKGHVKIAKGRCHPLTILDDHSRYSLGLEACAYEKGEVVKEKLTNAFRRYGMPWQILVDNGSPWGTFEEPRHTKLTVWIMRRGVKVIHSRPYHPQTLGKDERFHRTLKAEVLQYCRPYDLTTCQRRFDEWRSIYNLERPHEALNMEVPASRYRMSKRFYPERVPDVEYGPGDDVRKVHENGWIFYQGQEYRVGKAFEGENVGIRSTNKDGVIDVFFCNQNIAQIDLR